MWLFTQADFNLIYFIGIHSYFCKWKYSHETLKIDGGIKLSMAVFHMFYNNQNTNGIIMFNTKVVQED